MLRSSRLCRSLQRTAVRPASAARLSAGTKSIKTRSLAVPAESAAAAGAAAERVRGTRDYLPEDAEKHAFVENSFAQVAQRYRFREIRTPVLEKVAVFDRTLGETSDIVTKEMFRFPDGPHDVVLRPENTAGVVRALVAHNLTNQKDDRYYYCGPMFRQEEPQRGRYRQFNQFGVELIGWNHPHSDVECIEMAARALESIQLLSATKLHLNSLGDSASRESYRKALLKFFQPRKEFLSELSQQRLAKGAVMRILDSKADEDIALVTGTLPDEAKQRLETHLKSLGLPATGASAAAPLCLAYLNDSSRQRFDQVKEGLKRLNVQFKEDPYLIRGLDYYCHTAFEFLDSSHSGRQSAVLAGGRYDGLMKQMGGRDEAGVGWAAGIDRLVLLRDSLKLQTPVQRGAVGVVAIRGKVKAPGEVDPVTWRALELAQQLRTAGFDTYYSFDRQVPKQMRHATANNCLVCVMIGETELQRGAATVRDMTNSQQREVPMAQLSGELAGLLDRLQKQGVRDNSASTGH